jgi:hypothetical protein
MSATRDESGHILYGSRILTSHPDRLPGFNSQMPVSALNALPGLIASYMDACHFSTRISTVLRGFHVSRVPTIFATLLLNWFLFLWARDLYGSTAAVVVCLLAALSPSLIAHGTVATTDMYHALFVIGSLYLFRQFLLDPSGKHSLVAAFSLALAQLTKPFAIVLYAVVAVLVIIALAQPAGFRVLRRHALVFMGHAILCFLVVVNVAYSCDRTFTRFGSYKFRSEAFVRLQQSAVLDAIPVPLPYPFLQGLDMTKFSDETGDSFGNVYLLGQLGSAGDPSFHGFKTYYAVAVFFKEPIGMQILFLLGIISIWRNRNTAYVFTREGLLLGAAGVLVLWLSFFSRSQIGIRHILPALAVEVVIAGGAFSHFATMSRFRQALLCSLILWIGVSTASYFPHMIPYMNEWNYDRRLAYRILADSNLDWSQNAEVVKQFLRNNPDVVLNPEGPIRGRVLVNANLLTGVDRWNPSRAWLARSYRPVAHVGYAHFLFDTSASKSP